MRGPPPETRDAAERPPGRGGARAFVGARLAPTARGEALLVGAAVAAVHVARRPNFLLTLPGAFNDDGVYLVLGRALALGEGYRSIHVPGAPVQLKYPPGLPVVLAGLWGALGELGAVALAVRAINLLLVLLSAALLWWVARRRLALPAPLAVLAVLPLALEDVVQYWAMTLAEPWFVLGWAAALALACRGEDDAERAWPARSGAALGLVLGLTALFRTQAAVLLPAFALALALDRGSRGAALACLGAGALPILGWSVAQRALAARGPLSPLPDETPYTEWLPLARPGEWLPFAAERLRTTGEYYGEVLSRLLAGGSAGWAATVLVLLLALAGAARHGRRRLALSLPALAALATVVLWPWTQSRLLLPALPALALLAALALADLARALPSGARRAAGALSLLAALLVLLRQGAVRDEALAHVRGGTRPRAFLAADVLPLQSRLVAVNANWVEANTRPGDVVLVDVPAAVWLFTGRRALSAAPAESEAARSVFAVPGRFLAERVARDGVNVVATSFPDQPIARDVRAAQAACPGSLAPAGATRPGGFPAWFRVDTASACLRGLAGGPAPGGAMRPAGVSLGRLARR